MFVPGDRTGMKLGAPPSRGDLSFGAGYPARPRWPFAASDNGSSPSHRLQANRRQAGPSTQLGEKGASMPFEGSFEDRLALRDLLDAYADAVNRADSEAWPATWEDRKSVVEGKGGSVGVDPGGGRIIK